MDNSRNEKIKKVLQRKKLKNYKYKKNNYEEVFTLEDYLDEDEMEILKEFL